MNPKKTVSPFGFEEAAIIRAMIQHENELRNNRIMWFITIEGLLFAALGFAWKDATWLVYIFCFLGFTTAISFSRELRLSSLGLEHLKIWWKNWLHSHEEATYVGPPVIGLDIPTLPSSLKRPWGVLLRPARILPWLFVAAWVALLIVHLAVPIKTDPVVINCFCKTPPLKASTHLPPLPH